MEYSSDPSKTKFLSFLQKKYKSFNFEVHIGVDVLHRKLPSNRRELVKLISGKTCNIRLMTELRMFSYNFAYTITSDILY